MASKKHSSRPSRSSRGHHGNAVAPRPLSKGSRDPVGVYTFLFLDFAGRPIERVTGVEGTSAQVREALLKELRKRMSRDHYVYGGYAERERIRA